MPRNVNRCTSKLSIKLSSLYSCALYAHASVILLKRTTQTDISDITRWVGGGVDWGRGCSPSTYSRSLVFTGMKITGHIAQHDTVRIGVSFISIAFATVTLQLYSYTVFVWSRHSIIIHNRLVLAAGTNLYCLAYSWL